MDVLEAPAAVQLTIRRVEDDITTEGYSFNRRVDEDVYEAMVELEVQLFPLVRDSIQRMLDPFVAPRLQVVVVQALYATPMTDVPASEIAGEWTTL